MFKFTPSFYQSSDGNDAWDVNLRANHGPHAGWIGFYRDHQDAQQARGGYEYTQGLSSGQVVWSAQVAGGGFLGGSITGQFGDAVYLIAGFGRTDRHDYFNLNFDPNDAITLGLGGHLDDANDVSLYHIWDDRLGTRQHVTHLYLHHTGAGGQRFSVDGSWKSGLNSAGDYVRGLSVTGTYALGAWFLRIAHDRYANFGTADQNRISIGRSF